MTTAGTGGSGVVFTWDTAASSPLTVAEVRTISSSSPEAPKIDMSSHDTVQFRDFVYGLADRGTLRLEGILVPGDEGQAALDANSGTNTPLGWLVTFTSGATVAGTGGVTSFDFSVPYTDAHTFTCTIGITGAVSISPAGS